VACCVFIRWQEKSGIRLEMRLGVIAAAIAFWVASAIVGGVLLLLERKGTLERAEHALAARALMLEEHTLRTFQTVDVALAGVADIMRLRPDLPKHDPAFRQALLDRLQDLQLYVRAIFVLGADGSIIHDTDFPNTPDVSLADRPYFQRHARDSALERSISEPLLSRSGLGWFLAVNRRVGSGKIFGGIAVAAVQPRYFEALYRHMGLAEGDAITLFTRNGTLIAGYPVGEDAIGKSFADYPLFSKELPRRASGSYKTDEGMFSHRRLVSYRAIDDPPLVVGVAQSTDSILAAWRRTALGLAVALGALLLLLGVVCAQLIRHQRARERARQRVAQAEKLEALGHLTGGIAHDFANLLNVISANLHIISLEPENPGSTRHAAEVAARGVARGTELIRRLLTFARQRPLSVETADLNALVADSAALLRQAAGAQIEIAVEPASGLPACLTDKTEFEVALVNLVVNARQAGATHVALATGEAGNQVRLSIRDNGAGMSQKVRQRAFEPFYTTKGEAGTGLGLPQVYGFLQQMGGDVRIDSAPGSGTTVHLLFPKAPPGKIEGATR
jgi:two-component system NtrC family sensor kinase